MHFCAADEVRPKRSSTSSAPAWRQPPINLYNVSRIRSATVRKLGKRFGEGNVYLRVCRGHSRDI